jgi:hypothetical protein
MRSSKLATYVVAAAGIAIAGGVGYMLHKEAKKRSEARAVLSAISDASTHLKNAVKVAPPEAIEQIDAGVRQAHSWGNPAAADAAEEYLISVREILRRRAEANRLREKAAASREALHAHMSRAGTRTTPWIRAATDLKRQVDRDYFELNVKLDALANLWATLPEANKRIAPHIDESLLLEEHVRRTAHRAVLEEVRRHQVELLKTRDLLSPS